VVLEVQDHSQPVRQSGRALDGDLPGQHAREATQAEYDAVAANRRREWSKNGFLDAPARVVHTTRLAVPPGGLAGTVRFGIKAHKAGMKASLYNGPGTYNDVADLKRSLGVMPSSPAVLSRYDQGWF